MDGTRTSKRRAYLMSWFTLTCTYLFGDSNLLFVEYCHRGSAINLHLHSQPHKKTGILMISIITTTKNTLTPVAALITSLVVRMLHKLTGLSSSTNPH